MNDTTNDQTSKFQSYVKRAWVIYALAIVALILILVFLVAGDDEERFFFTIMPAAAAYVLRPTDKYIAKLVTRYTGVAQPAESE